MSRIRDIANILSGGSSAIATDAEIPSQVAGKNKIINGDFSIWQRGTSFNTSGWGYYVADRWQNSQYNGVPYNTITRESFTPGSAPVAGYEGQYYLRQVTQNTSDQNYYSGLAQYIEDVRTFAGQTVTISFWAKAASGTPNLKLEVTQFFGTGGTSANQVWNVGSFTLSTFWTRYTQTFTVPSISGKTIGPDNYLSIQFWTSGGTTYGSRMTGLQSNTFDFWGMQLEAGSVATAFIPSGGGGKQEELALCQRYYYKINAFQNSSYPVFGWGWANTSGNLIIGCQFPVTMRTKPSSIDTSGMSTFAWEWSNTASTTPTSITLDFNYSGVDNGAINIVKSNSFTVDQRYRLVGNANNTSYIGFNAEL